MYTTSVTASSSPRLLGFQFDGPSSVLVMVLPHKALLLVQHTFLSPSRIKLACVESICGGGQVGLIRLVTPLFMATKLYEIM